MGNRVSVAHNLQKMGPTILFVALSVLSVALTTSLKPVSAAPTGTYFDHIVIVAMENTPYQSVFGTGSSTNCPTSSAPFLCSMLPVSSTIPSMGNYGATSADSNDFNGCSAACYVGLMFGYTYGVSDGYSLSRDRKSTRLNSSHQIISYAVFCLKKKKRNPMKFCKRSNEIDAMKKYRDL